MEELLLHSVSVFMGFFAIMNPIANVPVFLGLTADDDNATRRRIAAKALLLTYLIVATFTVSGKLIFELFGITLFAFRITGGLLVFVIGYQMLHGENSRVHHPNQDDTQNSMDAKLSVAISPLAMPILAGPGTIATAMNYSAGRSVDATFITLGAFAVLCLLTYILFLTGERMVSYVGESALKVVTRLMGLILAVIGVQMVLEGLHEAFPK